MTSIELQNKKAVLIIYLIFLVLIMMMKAVVTMKRRILNQPQLQAKLKATTKIIYGAPGAGKSASIKKFIEKNTPAELLDKTIYSNRISS